MIFDAISRQQKINAILKAGFLRSQRYYCTCIETTTAITCGRNGIVVLALTAAVEYIDTSFQTVFHARTKQ
jgi:hypothetical protein